MGAMQNFRSVPSAITLGEGVTSQAVPKRVQVLKCGTYHHPQYGTFEITSDTLQAFVANFKNKVRKIDLAVDYKHASEDVAAGWIRDVELAEDALFLIVEWTPNGSKVLADKEFRYLSADFSLNYVDNETLEEYGPTLLGAGLTNRPVIKGMEPTIELNEGKGKQEMKTVEQLNAEVKKLADQVESKDKEIMDLKPKADKADAMQKKMGDQSLEDLMSRLEALEAQVKELQGSNEELMSEKKKLMDAAQYAEKKAAFDKLLTEGKAVEAQRVAYMENDFAKFAELASGVKLSETGSGASGGTTTIKTRADAAAEVRKLSDQKLKDKKAKTLRDAMSMVLAENPELAKLAQDETK